MLRSLSARGPVEGTPKACRRVQLLPEAWPEAQERDADDVENTADASGKMTEITVGGHAEHGTHSGPTFGLYRCGLHRFGLHRFGLHCFLLRWWVLILLAPFRRFRFSRLHVLFLAPPLPLPLPLLLHLDVRLRLRLQHPRLGLGLELMVVFVGVVLVVEVIGGGGAGPGAGDGGTQTGVADATGLCSELPRNLLPSATKTHGTMIITPDGTLGSTTAATWITRRINTQNNRKQLHRRVGRQKLGTYITYITQHTRSDANSLFLIIVHAPVTGSSSSRSSVRVYAIVPVIVTVLLYLSLRSSVLMSTRSSAARVARDGGGRLRCPKGCCTFSAAKKCSSGPPRSVPARTLGGLSVAHAASTNGDPF